MITMYARYRAFFDAKFPVLRDRSTKHMPAKEIQARIEAVRKAAESWDPTTSSLTALFSNVDGYTVRPRSLWTTRETEADNPTV